MRSTVSPRALTSMTSDGPRSDGNADQSPSNVAALVAGGALRSAAVVGAEGMGKTHFLATLASELAEAGVAVVEAPAYGGQLRLFATTLLAERLGAASPGLFDDAAVAALAVRRALGDVRSRGRRRALLFDDVHLLHEDDIAVIRSLILDPPTKDLFVGLALESEGSKVADELLAVLTHPALKSCIIPLQPLRVPELAGMAQQALGAVGTSFASRLRDFSGGTPLYAIGLLEDLAKRPVAERRQVLIGVRDIGSFGLPDAVEDAIRRRLASLTAPAIRVLEALAWWNGGATVEELCALCSVPPPEVPGLLMDLERSRFVVARTGDAGTPIRFELAEPIVALALRDGTSVLDAVQIHRNAVELYESRPLRPAGEELVQLVSHYLRGAVPLSPARVDRVLSAARHLNSTNRYAEARELLRSALRVFPAEVTPDHVAEAKELLAQALAHLGAPQEAEQLLAGYRLASTQTLAPDTWARLLARLGRIQVAAGKDSEATDTYRMVLETKAPVSSLIREQVLADLSSVYQGRGLLENALSVAREAAVEAETRSDLEMAAYARSVLGSLLVGGGHASQADIELRRAHRYASAAGNLRARARAIGRLGVVQTDLRDVGTGTRLLKRGAKLSQAQGDLASASTTARQLALSYLESGEWSDAEVTIRWAMDIDRELHREQSLAISMAFATLIDAVRGDWSGLPATVENGALAQLKPRVAWPQLAAMFEREIALRRPEAALQFALRMGSALEGEPGWERLWHREVLPRTATALFELGASDRLEVLLEQSRGFDIATGGSQPLVRAQILLIEGLSALARNRFASAVQRLGDAIDDLAGLGYNWRAARTRHYLGLAYSGAGQNDLAAEALKHAFADLSLMGANAAQERVRADLRSMNRRVPRSPDERSTGVRPNSSVTAREWDVIKLAVQGKTDAEIAASLWLSRRTVTTHVHNVLKKLGLRSRVELAAWLRAQDASGLPD